VIGAHGLRWVSAQSLGPVTYLLFNGADFLGLFEEGAACIPGGDDREDGKDRGGIALLVVAAIAAIWWLVGHKGWGAVQKVVFWVVLLAILWVVVTWYSAPHPGG
jgi:hypothetical protein